MIDLYTASTPNGWKVSITLEELGLPYRVFPIDLSTNEQKSPHYVQLNPNGRIPTIVDQDGLHGPFTVFESGAILMYLADKAGQLIPAGAEGRSTALQWVMFQVGGLGPMMGRAAVFLRYTAERIPFAVERYQRETRRLLELAVPKRVDLGKIDARDIRAAARESRVVPSHQSRPMIAPANPLLGCSASWPATARAIR